MASASTAALSAYLFSRIKADVEFLNRESLLDNGARDAILLQLDAAAARNGASSTSASVAGLSGQLSGVSFAQSPSPQPSHISGPPLPPSRQDHTDDGRERARALWNYAATQPDDLSFQKNDIIVITQKENEHWFRGFVSTDPSSRTGLFPSNHIEMLQGASTYPSQPGPEAHKGALEPYQHNSIAPQYYGGSQPSYYQQSSHQLQQQQPYHAPVPVASPAEPTKHSKFAPGTFKHTLATAAVGGAGFGAGSAAASSLVNAILH